VPELKDLKVGNRKEGCQRHRHARDRSRRARTDDPDLLRHTSGIAYDFFGNSLVKQEYKKIGVDGWDQTNAEMVQKLTKVPLQFSRNDVGLCFRPTCWDI